MALEAPLSVTVAPLPPAVGLIVPEIENVGAGVAVDVYKRQHYKLAECHERQRNWGAAIRELQRTIELQPDNWHAQIDLGQIVLAGGKSQDAKDRAMAVLHLSLIHI